MFVPCISRGEPVTRQYNQNLEAIEGTKVGNWRDRSTAALEHVISNTAPALLSAESPGSIWEKTYEASRPVVKSTHYRSVKERLRGAYLLMRHKKFRPALRIFEQARRAGWPDRNNHLETLWQLENLYSPSRANASVVLIQSTQTSAAGKAVSQFVARILTGTDELSQLVRRITDLGGDIIDYDAELARLKLGTEPADQHKLDELRSRLREVEAERKKLRRQLCEQHPAVCELLDPQPVALEQLQQTLEADEALIIVDTVQSDDGDDYLWAVTHNAATWLQIEPEGTDFDTLVLNLGDLIRPDLITGAIQPFDLAAQQNSHQLYQATLGQVEDLIANKSHLVFVLSGTMTSIPPHALVVEGPSSGAAPEFLIDRYAVTVAPSVRSFVSLRNKGALDRAPQPLLAFADPLYDPTSERTKTKVLSTFFDNLFTRGGTPDQDKLRSLSRLKETQVEVEAVRKALGGSDDDIYLRSDASETTLKQLSEAGELANHKVIYLATHGFTAKQSAERLSAGAEPGLALAGPLEATELDDGFLTASEAALLKLNADWVVLAACNTAAASETGSIGMGDAEALSGLARSFFYAGARSLLVSHWAVNSEATVDLMMQLFNQYGDGQTVTGAEALQAAMLKVKAQRRWNHPYYWAPFILVGQPE